MTTALAHTGEVLATTYENLLHDIKAPLSIMYSYMQTIEEMEGLPAEVVQCIAGMKRNWMRVMKLVRDAGDRTKLSKGLMIPEFADYDIVQIVSEITDAATTLAIRKHIRLNLHTDTQKKIMAVDKAMIERILLNLLSNAVKFTNDNGRIDVYLSDRGNKLFLSVCDTGTGVPDEVRKHLFKKRGNISGGLGLTIVKDLVDVLGGTITVKTSAQGTQIQVRLPVFHVATPQNVEEGFSDKLIQIELSEHY